MVRKLIKGTPYAITQALFLTVEISRVLTADETQYIQIGCKKDIESRYLHYAETEKKWVLFPIRIPIPNQTPRV